LKTLSLSLPENSDLRGQRENRVCGGSGNGVAPEAIEVWFADEARVGQKNKITRRWAKRGTREALFLGQLAGREFASTDSTTRAEDAAI
jgi:hypothetical protein